MARNRENMATEKQKKAIKLLLENVGNKENTKTAGQILKEAGYSENIQKNPYLILESETIKQGLIPVADELKKQRRKAIKRLGETVNKASYRDVNDAVDKLTKNIQLLGGKPTETVKHTVEGFNMIQPHDPNDKTVTKTIPSVAEATGQDN